MNASNLYLHLLTKRTLKMCEKLGPLGNRSARFPVKLRRSTKREQRALSSNLTHSQVQTNPLWHFLGNPVFVAEDFLSITRPTMDPQCVNGVPRRIPLGCAFPLMPLRSPWRIGRRRIWNRIGHRSARIDVIDYDEKKSVLRVNLLSGSCSKNMRELDHGCTLSKAAFQPKMESVVENSKGKLQDTTNSRIG